MGIAWSPVLTAVADDDAVVDGEVVVSASAAKDSDRSASVFM